MLPVPNWRPARHDSRGLEAELAGLTDRGALLLKAAPAQNGTALSRLEGDGGFRAALRANGACLRAHRAGAGCPFGLALFAALGVVLELLVEEEELLTRSEHEIVPAVHAFENLVDELHPLPSPLAEAPTEPRVIFRCASLWGGPLLRMGLPAATRGKIPVRDTPEFGKGPARFDEEPKIPAPGGNRTMLVCCALPQLKRGEMTSTANAENTAQIEEQKMECGPAC